MNKTKRIALIAMIAAVYTAVSMALAPISFGQIQCRLSESLTMLPLIYAPAIPGLILGCFLTNLIGVLTGANMIGVIDTIVGTTATAIAAYLTYYFRNQKVKNIPVLSALMPIIINGVFVGTELGFLFFEGNVVLGSIISGVEVAIGETLAVIVGLFLVKALAKIEIFK